MSIDLHCHSTISDGSLTIPELIRHAKERGVTHLSITDHDTTKGVREAIRIGREFGIEVIPGVEISAYDFKRKRRAHLLGYYIQENAPAITAICDPLIERRREASYRMYKMVKAAGYDIEWEEVEGFSRGGTGVFKQHIMHALLKKGYTAEIYGPLYKKLFQHGESGTKGIAFIPIEYIDVKIAIKAVLEAGGVPVLAHPGLYGNFESVPELADAGLLGIEVKHPSHDQRKEEIAYHLAKTYHLVMTGGSDYHGFYGDHPYDLGSKDPGRQSVMELRIKHIDSLTKI